MTSLAKKIGITLWCIAALAMMAGPALPALAQTSDGSATTQVSCSIVQLSLMPVDFICIGLYLAEIVVDALEWVAINVASFLFQKVIEMNSITTTPPYGILSLGVIQDAWSIARDVANLFFIVILIISAVATIFDLEMFHIRSILPRIILAALLINFSLVIGRFIIDESNQLGNLFYSLSTQTGGGAKSFEEALSDVLSLNALGAVANIRGLDAAAKNQTPLTGSETPSQALARIKEKTTLDYYDYSNCAGADPEHPPPNCTLTLNNQTCGNPASASYSQNERGCKEWEKQVFQAYAGENNIGVNFYKQMALRIIAKLLVYSVALFVLLAGTFLMFMRLIALVFVLILGPLAFLGYIIPGQSNWWSKWWTTLIQQSFFFPAFTFTILIAMRIFNGIKDAHVFETAGAVGGLVSYGVGVSLFVGGLIVAQQMKIGGANTAMAVGKRMRGWALTKGKNAAIRTTGAVATGALGTGAAAAIRERIPVLGAALRPLEKAAAARQKLAGEREKKRVQKEEEMASIKGLERYSGARFIASSKDDQDKIIETLKPSQLRRVMAGMSDTQIQNQVHQTLVRQKDEKMQTKIISAVEGFDRKIAAQTGRAAPAVPRPEELRAPTPPMPPTPVAGPEAATAFTQQMTEYQRRNIEVAQLRPESERQWNEYQKAAERTLGSMPAEDIRKLTYQEMMTNATLRAAIERFAATKGFARNLVNSETKAAGFSDLVVEAAGLNVVTMREELEKPQRNERRILEQIRDALIKQADKGDGQREDLRALADRVNRDPLYQRAILDYIPMSARFTPEEGRPRRELGEEEEEEAVPPPTSPPPAGGGATTT